MKKLIVIVGLAVFGLTIVPLNQALAGRFAERQVRQQARIYRGAKCGELTHREFGRLEREQGCILHNKREMKADGNFTQFERMRMERMQDRANTDIYRLKHNAWERNR